MNTSWRLADLSSFRCAIVRSYCFFWKGVASERLSSTDLRILACSSLEAKSYNMLVRITGNFEICQACTYLVREEALCTRYRGQRASLFFHELLHGALHDIGVIDHFERRVAGRQFPSHKRERMILKVVANSFVLNLALDAGSFEHLRVTNTGQLQNLRRLDSTARYHDFTLHIDSVGFGLVCEVDADSLVTFQLYRSHGSFAQNMQIWSVCIRGKPASSSIASLSLVGTCTSDRAERVENTDVVARPAEMCISRDSDSTAHHIILTDQSASCQCLSPRQRPSGSRLQLVKRNR